MKPFPSILSTTEQLSKDQIEKLLSLAKQYKNGQDPLFFFNNNPFILSTLFLENSTRTKTSFAIATKKLGGHYIDFNVDTSSLKKGENLEETLLTLKYQGVDLCVVRTPNSNEFEAFYNNPIKIINGGDGINQHPSQGLLDLFTFLDLGLDPKGRTMVIIGDVLHSRVFNSLSDLFIRFGGQIIICGPNQCLPENTSSGIEVTDNLEYALSKADMIYTLRIQKERHQKAVSYYETYPEKYGLTLRKLKNNISVFHPGPVNIGVELTQDILRSSHYQGYQQVTNSIYMRMAIITAMLKYGC